MSTKRTLRLSNIRSASKFTGEQDSKYYYSAFAYASGPAPAELDLSKYNALVSNQNASVADLQNALEYVSALENKYNALQSNSLTAPQAKLYLQTIKSLKSEIQNAINTAQNKSTTTTTGGNSNDNTSGIPGTTQSKWATTRIILTSISGAVVLGGGFIFVKWLINRNKGK